MFVVGKRDEMSSDAEGEKERVTFLAIRRLIWGLHFVSSVLASVV
jgi:hypothetical protein